MYTKKISPREHLRLDVAAPSSWNYSPGDTVIGQIVRASPIVSSGGLLKIWITGAINIDIAPSMTSSDEETYTAKWTLFNPTEYVVYRGPLQHLGNNEETLNWDFAIQIPTKPRKDIADGHTQQESFVPFNKDHLCHHTLPGSIRVSQDSRSAKIEYAIHTELEYDEEGTRKRVYTTTPILLRNGHENIDQSVLSKGTTSAPVKIKSQRLLPGQENVQLSFRQKAQKMFSSSKTPELWFKIIILSPSVVQFNNPEPLPITLRIETMDETSQEIKDIPQQIQINYIRIRIKSRTAVIARGNYGKNPKTHHMESDVDFRFEDAFKTLQDPLVMYSLGQNESISLCDIFQPTLRKDGLYTNGKRCSRTLTPTLFPDICTFGLKHTHQFDYRVNLTVAGESREIQVFVPVKIQDVD